MPVFIRMPSTPCSITITRRTRCPTPASTITGTLRAVLDRADGERVEHAEPRADRRCQRHHRDGARVLEPERRDQVVVRVRHHLEAFGGQHARRLDVARGVREQRLLVADHLELDPLVEAGRAREPRVADRRRRRCSSRRCWRAGRTARDRGDGGSPRPSCGRDPRAAPRRSRPRRPTPRSPRSSAAFDAYLPVPTIRRERNSRPPIVESVSECRRVIERVPSSQPPPTKCTISSMSPSGELERCDTRRDRGGSSRLCSIDDQPRIELRAMPAADSDRRPPRPSAALRSPSTRASTAHVQRRLIGRKIVARCAFGIRRVPDPADHGDPVRTSRSQHATVLRTHAADGDHRDVTAAASARTNASPRPSSPGCDCVAKTWPGDDPGRARTRRDAPPPRASARSRRARGPARTPRVGDGERSARELRAARTARRARDRRDRSR